MVTIKHKNMIASFADQLSSILEEITSTDYKAAVGIVQYKDRWLLGLSTATDDRKNKWAFPGGHLKPKETPEQGAVREVREETGVICKAVGDAFSIPARKGVAFVHCKATNPDLDNNHEFAALGWFDVYEMRSLKLYSNVRSLIDRVS